MLSDYFEPFALLERTRSADPLGGTDAAWRDALIFSGGVTYVPGGETQIAGLRALRTIPVLAHEFDVTLRQGDLVRRVSDGAVYRVAGQSSDMRTPACADLRFAQVPVEKVVLSP